MEPPTPDELGPLLGDTNDLDAPAPPDDTEGSEFEAAAVSAVGTRQKAMALKDAITACLREHGLLSDAPGPEDAENEAEPDEDDDLPY
jgi:hypothetical protein